MSEANSGQDPCGNKWNDGHNAAMDMMKPVVAKQAARIEELEAGLSEERSGFDLRWKADMRAIERWQAATGKELTWPDHADLCVWLMEQLDALKPQEGG